PARHRPAPIGATSAASGVIFTEPSRCTSSRALYGETAGSGRWISTPADRPSTLTPGASGTEAPASMPPTHRSTATGGGDGSPGAGPTPEPRRSPAVPTVAVPGAVHPSTESAAGASPTAAPTALTVTSGCDR